MKGDDEAQKVRRRERDTRGESRCIERYKEREGKWEMRGILKYCLRKNEYLSEKEKF